MHDLVTTSRRRQRYYERGHWTTETIWSRLTEHAVRRPSATAVVDSSDGRRISFEELHRDVLTLSTFLADRGLGRGDVISVQLPNRYETVVADLAAHAIGAVLNPLIPNYRQLELEYILAAARSRALFTPATYRNFDYLAMAEQLTDLLPALQTHVIVDDDVPDTAGTTMRSILQAPSALAGDAVGGPDPDDITDVMFTSGTEATPKAVMHTDNTANFGVRSLYRAVELTPEDVIWMPSPLGHSLGVRYGLRLAVNFGLPLVLQDRWDPVHAIRIIREYGCTYTMAAPTFLNDLVVAARDSGDDLTSLRVFCSGGGPVAPELVRAAQAVGVHVLRLYGSSEGLVMTVNRTDSPMKKLLETDGLPLDDIELRIRDEAGTVAAPGAPGEIEVRGPDVCVGFFDDDERTRRAFGPDGWMKTGDIGVLDEDGYLSIIARKKEIIIRGGVNITPREIEDLLSEMDGIHEAAVVGLPDDRLGEVVCACVVPHNRARVELADVVKYLGARGIAKYKLPQRLEVLSQFPRTPTGKVRKTVLVESLTTT